MPSRSLGLRIKSYGAAHSSIAISVGQFAPLPSGVTDADGDGAVGWGLEGRKVCGLPLRLPVAFQAHHTV